MTRLRILATLAVGLAGAFGTPGADAADQSAVALKARAVFKQHCAACHHGENSDGGNFDVLDPRTLLKPEGRDKPYVVPGKPGESDLFRLVDSGKMPLKSVKQRPTEADRAAIRAWIAAGVPAFPAAEARTLVPHKAVLAAVRDDLRRADVETRPTLRYFSLAHLHNNPRVSDADLRIHGAALSKAINSLTWKPRIVLPRALDKDQTVFAVDIRDLDWDKKDLWTEVMKAYPYGLRYDHQPDAELRDIDAEVERLAGCEIPLVRADWFVSTATRPPLYHTLLQLPNTAGELETMLQVDIASNFLRGQMARAGFRGSNVSGQNRLVDRHDALTGAYWKSWDFKPDNPKAELTQFPLGPVFKGNPFERFAFEHDGGEIIFNLANGMQGYFLVNGKDERIDEGPQVVVSDERKTSGTSAIVNGLSCIACHAQGMRTFKDQVRDGAGVFGDAQRKVRQLYPTAATMSRLLAEDSDRFLRAVEKATGPFLRTGADKDRPIAEFPEMVGEVARQYRLADLDLTTAALELDIEKPEELKAAIARSDRLREMGLAPLLLENGVVKRQEWEAVGRRSLLQRVALELNKGTPIVVLR